jgi:hypothetical protein
MRSSRKPVAMVALLSFLAVPVGAWLVFGAHDQDAPKESSAEGKVVSAFWNQPAAQEHSSGAMTTHGGWFCANPDCRFLKMSGGQVFRSAKAQSCSLCRQPLVQDRPVAAAATAKKPVTAPEGG